MILAAARQETRGRYAASLKTMRGGAETKTEQHLRPRSYASRQPIEVIPSCQGRARVPPIAAG